MSQQSPVKLSANFSSEEFKCPHCGSFQVDMRLINALEELRKLANKPLKILSGYRCVEHNKAVGGAASSEHTRGMAADVAVPKGMTMNEFYSKAASVPGLNGIGVYPQEGFIHVDVRAAKARWARIANQYVGIDQGLTYNKVKGKA